MGRTSAVDYIGSVSSGTMRPADLIPAFLAVLDDIAPAKADAWREDWPGVEEDTETDTEGYAMEELFDILDGLAPPGFYFGAHPGDGADYGFWREDPGFYDDDDDDDV